MNPQCVLTCLGISTSDERRSQELLAVELMREEEEGNKRRRERVRIKLIAEERVHQILECDMVCVWYYLVCDVH